MFYIKFSTPVYYYMLRYHNNIRNAIGTEKVCHLPWALEMSCGPHCILQFPCLSWCGSVLLYHKMLLTNSYESKIILFFYIFSTLQKISLIIALNMFLTSLIFIYIIYIFFRFWKGFDIKILLL